MSIMLLNNKELLVLSEFSSDYHKRIYGREIAKKLGMNQKTASNILKNLEKENVIKFSVEGRNKYYFLNKFNQYVVDIIKSIEIGRKILFLKKYKKFHELFEKLQQRSQGILVVFGSYAKFTSSEKSDLDLFVKGSISDIGDLEELYNIKINIVKSGKGFDRNEHFVREIIKNHIVLKGVEDFVELIW